MPNAFYPLWKQNVLQISANNGLNGTVRAALVDTGVYTYSASHQFLSSLSGVIGTAQTLSSKTFTNGVFDAADIVYTGVSGASAEAIVLYIDTGVAGTSPLVTFIDTGVTGLPVTPNSGNINIVWDATGVFAL